MARRYKQNAGVQISSVEVGGVAFKGAADTLVRSFRASRRKAGLDDDDVVVVQPKSDPEIVLLLPFSLAGDAFIDSAIAALERMAKPGGN